jgi:hypothetical protein
MDRPKCGRYGGPLDIVWDEDADGMIDRYRWSCNNLDGKCTPIWSDEEYQDFWDGLILEDQQDLQKQLRIKG